MAELLAHLLGLNPRFDGAFLNYITASMMRKTMCLNPRFDGAFLNYNIGRNVGIVHMS